jgi:hypothetical protein
MTQYKQKFPPPIKEIITPPDFAQDLDLQELIVAEKMKRDYVSVLFICSILLIIVVIL